MLDQASVIGHKPAAAGRGSLTLLVLALISGLAFVAVFASPYVSLNQEAFGPYWPRRGWLWVHVGAGAVALLTGPGQLWLGLTRRRLDLHRRLGIIYMTSVGVGSVAAFSLAASTDVGWVFGAGLTGLAIAWIVTTGLAFAAVRRGLIQQHQEWMIRSYVATFAFVTFRIFVGVLEATGVGTVPDRLVAASWFCWAVPLVITEATIQGRKIFA